MENQLPQLWTDSLFLYPVNPELGIAESAGLNKIGNCARFLDPKLQHGRAFHRSMRLSGRSIFLFFEWGQEYLKQLPISPEDLARITHLNAQRVLKL